MPLFLGASVMLSLNACVEEWGQADPPAAVQKNVAKATLATYAFEDPAEMDNATISPSEENAAPEIVADEDPTYGNVLHLQKGTVAIPNPYKGSYAENLAFSSTFFVKQALAYDYKVDEDGVVIDSTLINDDVVNLISFLGSNDQSLDINANGTLSLDSYVGNMTLCAEPSGMLRNAGDWHYVAMSVTRSNYEVWVDGYKRISATPTVYDYDKLIQFISNASTIQFGGNAVNDLYVDNFTFTNSPLEASQTKDPRVKNSGGGENGGEGGFNYIDGEWADGIGAPDCSTGWWSEFSPYFRIPADGVLTLKFTNHTSGGGNWNNWNLCLCTDAPRGDGNYAEYVVVRSDLYGWGGSYDTGIWTNEGYGDWDAFRADMEGAQVTITVTRDGAHFVIDAVATCNNGNVYHETFTSTAGDGTQVIRAFLIVDSSYLEMDREGCSITVPIEVPTESIGAPDCSTGWWAEFSDYFQIPANSTLTLKFENHTSGGGNWNNWNLCLCTDAERGAGDYAEYVVVRSDLYGWGGSYDTGVWTNEGYGDWDAFRADMEGAQVTITVTRDGAQFVIDAVATCPNGNVYHETFTSTAGDGTQMIRAFLIVDGSHLKMDTEHCTLSSPI